jgi:hypothetical protein
MEVLAVDPDHNENEQEHRAIERQEIEELRKALADLGMEDQIKMTANAMANDLGFMDAWPVSFNEKKYKFVVADMWDKEDEGSGEMEQLKLEWVQLDGVHLMVMKAFTSKPQTMKAPGVLLANEVGMGKMAQIMAFIAFLLEVKVADDEKKNRPMMTFEYSNS